MGTQIIETINLSTPAAPTSTPPSQIQDPEDPRPETAPEPLLSENNQKPLQNSCTHTPDDWRGVLKEEVEKKFRAHAERFGVGDNEDHIQKQTEVHTRMSWRVLEAELKSECPICNPDARKRLAEKDLLKLK